MHSKWPDGLGRLNPAGISDAKLVALIEASGRATDVQQRAERMRAARRRIAELQPIAPLVVETSAVIHSDRILWEPGLHLSLRPGDMRPRRP
jgi:ABC-type transport system substrate-binding protein